MVASATGIFAALLTSFYSWRLIFLTFFGSPRWAGSEHIQHAAHEGHGHKAHGHDDPTLGYHPHESPLAMMVPLALLSLGAVFAGAVFHGSFVGVETAGDFWKNSTLFFDRDLFAATETIPAAVKWAPLVVMLTGLAIAWVCYIRNPRLPAMFVARFGPLHAFLFNKWYVDELYELIFVKPAYALGRAFWRLGDIGIIDRFGPNGAAYVVGRGSGVARRVQSGFLTSYALWMLAGLVAAVSWVLVR